MQSLQAAVSEVIKNPQGRHFMKYARRLYIVCLNKGSGRGPEEAFQWKLEPWAANLRTDREPATRNSFLWRRLGRGRGRYDERNESRWFILTKTRSYVSLRDLQCFSMISGHRCLREATGGLAGLVFLWRQTLPKHPAYRDFLQRTQHKEVVLDILNYQLVGMYKLCLRQYTGK
jgi:hypothetical protein